MAALDARSGFWSHQWFMEKEALTQLRRKSCFHCQDIFNFISRNILKFSLVQIFSFFMIKSWYVVSFRKFIPSLLCYPICLQIILYSSLLTMLCISVVSFVQCLISSIVLSLLSFFSLKVCQFCLSIKQLNFIDIFSFF